MIRYALGLSMAILLLSAPALAAPTKAYERGTCPATVAADEKIECGILTVPENRSVPKSRLIRLPVMIFRSRAPLSAADPIIFLNGGPGGSNLSNKKSGKTNPFLDTRDYILMEPRGARLSQPALECPKINALKGVISAGHLRGPTADAALSAAAADCREDLMAQGIDLNGYTSREAAQDIEDLRVALGITKWNLFGHSYGTRLALTVLRDHPEGVRSVILDSVLPPEVNFDESASVNLWRALHGVFDNCATNAACHAAYPNLASDFTSLILQADETPLDFMPQIMGADNLPVSVGGAEVVDAIYSALHSPTNIPQIPKIIEDAYHGNTMALGELIRGNQGASGFSWGLRLSVWCGEEMPFEDAKTVEDQTSPLWQLGGIDERAASVAMCQAWNVAPAARIETAPVASDVPVLILTGEYDPDTPPDWGRGLLAHMPNAQAVFMPGMSHGAGFNPCGFQIERAFLNKPKGPIDTTCAAKMRGADFGLTTDRSSPG